MPEMEEFAFVLDYLVSGRPDEKAYHKSPLVISIGSEEFKLLELIPKNNAVISVKGRKTWIGPASVTGNKLFYVCSGFGCYFYDGHRRP